MDSEQHSRRTRYGLRVIFPGRDKKPATAKSHSGTGDLLIRENTVLLERLASLSARNRHALQGSIARLTIPSGIALFGLFGYLAYTTFANQMLVERVMEAWWMLILSTTCLMLEILLFLTVRLAVEGCFLKNYRSTLLALHNTDLPAQIVSEQCSSDILDELKQVPLFRMLGLELPDSLEARLEYAANYCAALRAFGSDQSTLDQQIRNGTVLYFSGTQLARALNWLATLLIIVMIAFPPLFAFPAIALLISVFKDAERRGNLKAMCDYFGENYSATIGKYEDALLDYDRQEAQRLSILKPVSFANATVTQLLQMTSRQDNSNGKKSA